MKKLPSGAQTKRQGEPQAGEHPIVTVGLTGRVFPRLQPVVSNSSRLETQPPLRFGLV